jgi:hypothetical protein
MTDTIWILILIGLGLVLAYRTAQGSNNREKIQGGAIAQIGNYVASAMLAMLAPVVLANIFFIQPTFLGTEILLPVLAWDITKFAHVLVIAVVMVGIAVIFLIPYAIAEKPKLEALKQGENRGWTREDAETSGL